MKPAGERLPYTAMALGAAMLATYVVDTMTPRPPVPEILRDGPSPRAAWQRPSVEALLAGRDCIPMSILLKNRVPETEHSFARDVACRS